MYTCVHTPKTAGIMYSVYTHAVQVVYTVLDIERVYYCVYMLWESSLCSHELFIFSYNLIHTYNNNESLHFLNKAHPTYNYIMCIPVALEPVVARCSSASKLSSFDSNISFGSSSNL